MIARLLLPLLVACSSPPSPPSSPPAGPTYAPLDATDGPEAQLQNRHEDRTQVMEILALQPGMSVADVGCGAGYFTGALARAVGPTGHVWATELKEDLVKALEARLEKEPGLDPDHVITALVNRPNDLGIAPDSLDVVFMAHLDFYLFAPLLPDQVAFLESVARAAKPGGRLVVVQWMGVRSAYKGADGRTQEGSLDNLVANFDRSGWALDRTVIGRRPSTPEPARSPGVPGPVPEQYDTRVLAFHRR